MWGRRAAAVAATALLAGGILMATGGPASADRTSCQIFLESQGYHLGKLERGACTYDASYPVSVWLPVCESALMDAGVTAFDAETACTLATQPTAVSGTQARRP